MRRFRGLGRNPSCLAQAALTLAVNSVVLLSSLPGCGLDPGTVPGASDSTDNGVSVSVDPAGETPDEWEQDGGPKLSFSASRAFCCDPLRYEFVASLPPGSSAHGAQFAWDFGDGWTGSGVSAEHQYSRPGNYLVRVTAYLSNGEELSAEGILDVGATAAASTPRAFGGPDQIVLGGQAVTLNGTVSGVPDGGEPTLSWRQVFGDDVELRSAGAVAGFTAPQTSGLPIWLEFEFELEVAAATVSDTVRVTVWPATTPTAGNVAPAVFDTSLRLPQNQPTAVLLSGSDFNGDFLSFEILAPPRNGSLSRVGQAGADSATFLYSPKTGFVGADAFTFRASDGRAFSSAGTATIEVASLGDWVEGNSPAYLVPAGRSARITLNPVDLGQASATFSVAALPAHGQLSVSYGGPGSMTVVYTPDTGFEGLDAFEVRLSGGAASLPTVEIELTVQKLLIPWLEVNEPTGAALDVLTAGQGAELGMTMLDYCVAGIGRWAKVTDTIVVTTMPGQSRHLYPELLQRVPPGVRIIGGLKTTRLPGGSPGDPREYDFADPATWSTIAGEAQQIAAYTGVASIVLENETPLEPYTHGRERIDHARLAQALSLLEESGLEYWWNLPRILPDTPEFPDRRADTTALVGTIVEALPDSVFLGGYTAWYDWRYQIELRETMLDLVGQERLQERLLVTPGGYLRGADFEKRCFTPAEAIARLPELTGNSANVYPGVEYWIEVGGLFAEQLPPLADPAD